MCFYILCRFLTDQRRLNVAITRAKKALYIIGHLRTFQFNEHWSSLIAHAEKQNIIVRVDNMSCVEECLNKMTPNSSVGVTKNLAYNNDKTKDAHDQFMFNSAPSHNTVAEKSSVIVTKETSSNVVDRSAFSLQRKSIQYIDTLPKSTPEASKSSPSKKMLVSGKGKSKSSSELKTKDQTMEPSPKKGVLPKNDKHTTSFCSSSIKHAKLKVSRDTTLSSAMDKEITKTRDETTKSVLPSKCLPTLSTGGMQKTEKMNDSDHATELTTIAKSTNQTAIQTANKKKSNFSSKTEALHSAMASSVHSTSKSSTDNSLSDNTTFDTSMQTNTAASSCGNVNVQSSSSNRHVRFNIISTHDNTNDTRTTDRWGGQRKRTSHFANLSVLQQVRKRHRDYHKGHCDGGNKSKKTKLN